MFDNNLTLGKKTNNPPTTEKWTCSFPEKRPIFMIDWLKSVAHWRQNPQMRSNDWFLLFCGWSHYTITKRSYERSRKGGNELATISQCMKKRPNFIGDLINLQERRLFFRTPTTVYPWTVSNGRDIYVIIYPEHRYELSTYKIADVPFCARISWV